MGITAIALLRIQGPLSAPALRAQVLQDAVLLFTGESFASDPDVLSLRVQAMIGSSLASTHTDPRGIFFIPDVAVPTANTYEGVIEEIGEGGMWGRAHGADTAAATGLAGGALGALLGQIPSSIWQAAGEAARGDEGALQDAATQLQSLLGESSELRALAGQLAGSLGQLGAANSGQAPDLGQLVAGLRDQLESDPTRLTQLAEQLLGPRAAQPPDEDDEGS